MDPTLRARALALYKPPFRSEHGYIYDYEGTVVLVTRGWGRIQYQEQPESLQDATGELLAEALTFFWRQQLDLPKDKVPRCLACNTECLVCSRSRDLEFIKSRGLK